MPIEARVGVNTGEVVVRSISTGGGHVEYTPIGHTANLASRRQAVAPTRSIAISEQTRKLVDGYFQLKPLGPTKVKGVTEPVNVYEVIGTGSLRTRLDMCVANYCFLPELAIRHTQVRHESTASFSCLGSQFLKPQYRVTCMQQAGGQHSRGGPLFAIKL